MVEKYIYLSLFESDYVVLPNFGGFVLNYQPAKINPLTHQISPPSKAIAFNSMLKTNDGFLVQTISREEGISMLEAEIILKDFIQTLQFKLSEHKHFILNQLGIFKINTEGSLVFEAEVNLNFMKQTFLYKKITLQPNFDDFSLQNKENQHTITSTFNKNVSMANPIPRRPAPSPIRKSQPKPLAAKTSSASGEKSNMIPLIMFLMFLCSTFATYIVLYNQNDVSQGSLNPMNWYNAKNQLIPESSEQNLGISENLESKNVNTETTNEMEETEVVSDSPEPAKELSTAKIEKNAKEDFGFSEPEAKIETKKITNSSITSLKSNRYFVIIAGFENPKNAEKFRDKLISDGLDSKIIEPYTGGNNLYRVSLDDFDNITEALKRKDNLISTYGADLWVLKR